MKMNKYLMLIIILTAAGFYIWSAREARKKSDDIMARFKEVDSSLNNIESPGKKKGMEAIQENYLDATAKSELILLIDSIKDSFDNLPDSAIIPSVPVSTTKRLLNGIQQLNRSRWNMMDSATPDTIVYSTGADKFSEAKWNAFYFHQQPKTVVLTYCNYLRNQLLNLH
jgi:hypothetical protein